VDERFKPCRGEALRNICREQTVMYGLSRRINNKAGEFWEAF